MCGLRKSVAGISPDWHNSECLVSMLSGKMGLVWQDDEERTWSSHVVAECHEARGFHSPRVPCYVSMSAPHRMVASDASGAWPQSLPWPGPPGVVTSPSSGGEHTGSFTEYSCLHLRPSHAMMQ